MPKAPLEIQDQIALLDSRGMKFRNVAKAPHFLLNISYYRLKGYWWEKQIDKVNHEFEADTYFEDILDLYNFDRRFRLIVFNAIERIEIALRTKLIYHLSLSYGPYWHYDPTLFQIAKEFGLNNQKHLASWLLSVTYIRNVVAHHGRLWNRVLINKYDWPKNSKYPLLSYIPNQYQRRKIFPLLTALIYMNNRISPGHHIKDDLLNLFLEFPNTPLYKLGFPKDWENEPIWQ